MLSRLSEFAQHPDEDQNAGPLLSTLFSIPEGADGTHPIVTYWPTHSRNLELTLIPDGDVTELVVDERGALVDERLYILLLEFLERIDEPKSLVKPRTTSAEDERRNQPAHSEGPWDVIKNPKDQEMVRLWWNGMDAKTIGTMIDGVQPRTIHNRLYGLRKEYGQHIVPLHSERLKRGLL